MAKKKSRESGVWSLGSQKIGLQTPDLRPQTINVPSDAVIVLEGFGAIIYTSPKKKKVRKKK